MKTATQRGQTATTRDCLGFARKITTGFVLTGLIVLTLATQVFAMHGEKGNDHVLQNPGTPDGREGGETISTAIPIGTIPFMDTGNICDNYDDYDEVCPYTGDPSPDIVYSYTPVSDEAVDIDMCGSGYDTKLFVYENGWTPGNPYACNDDFYFGDPCGVWVSKIEGLSLYAGNTYYIIVDGYGGDCGDYVLEVSGTTSSPVLVRSFVEDFTTVEFCDTDATTAFWDTDMGHLCLPPNPDALIGGWDTLLSARGIALAGDVAYLADHGSLVAIDISDPGNPVGIGSVETPGNVLGVAVAGNIAYVADDTGGGLQLIDISYPSAMEIIGEVDTPS
ncbi:hypothetical protein ACFL6M_08055, partial [Candidatus Eisenbacteria bacterium]